MIPLRWDDIETHSRIEFTKSNGLLVINFHLKSRKNLQGGDVISRKCICDNKQFKELCPVHSVLQYLIVSKRAHSGKLFNFSYHIFQEKMRTLLAVKGTQNANKVTTKAFRRGTANKLVKEGGSLAEILAAGAWHSPAYLKYLLTHEVEQENVFNVFMQADNMKVDDDEDDHEVRALPPRKIQKLVANQSYMDRFLRK